MPVTPAWLARRCLDDPRKIPYLLVWKDERDGEIKEAVRLAHGGFSDLVELKRTDERTTVLRIVWQMMSRNGGRALFLLCPHCDRPSRLRAGNGIGFQGARTWSVMSVGNADLALDSATLPKAAISAAGVVRWPPYFALTELTAPRALPYLFTSPEVASEAGVCDLSSVS